MEKGLESLKKAYDEGVKWDKDATQFKESFDFAIEEFLKQKIEVDKWLADFMNYNKEVTECQN